MRRALGVLAVFTVLFVVLSGAGPVWADTPEEEMSGLTANLDGAIAAANDHDVATAEAAYRRFVTGWSQVEGDIRARSVDSYRAIEDAMLNVSVALASTPVDEHKVLDALRTLDAASDQFISGGYAGSTALPEGVKPTLASVAAKLDAALAALEQGDAPLAAQQVADFRRDWPTVEGLVQVKSPKVYEDIENTMAKAVALLASSSPDIAGAKAVLSKMQADLQPMLQGGARYGVFDAAIILLREGMEALLVVAGLLAFVRKTGQAEKGKWIWAGSGSGLLASVAIAVVVNVAFAASNFGGQRELLEGLTGLAAAGMLIYMSYWLHTKSSLGAWQHFIREKSSSALARNSVFSLALIAFLAVFREGAETVLFYVGIAPSITVASLLTGLLLGAGALAIVGVLILAFGLRIPVRQFFLITSFLVLYLAFKFTGAGLHSLQVAGILRATPASFLPSNGLLGLFPTWETTAPQMVLVLVALLVLGWTRLRPRRSSEAAE